MKSKFRLLTLSASLLACGLGAAGNAQANAYAFAYDNVSNFFLTASNVAPTAFGTPVVTTADSASLNGPGVANVGPPAAPFGPTAAPISNAPGGAPLQVNNAFAPLGGAPNSLPGATYAWGDARIINQQNPAQTIAGLPCGADGSATTCGHFVNAAESNIAANGFSAAAGNNASGTVFTIPITITTGSQISVQFNAEPYLQAFLAASSLPGSKAHADISAVLDIFALDASGKTVGAPVVHWTPNGIAGDGTGLVSEVDPYALNISFDQSIPGTSTHDPSAAIFGATQGKGSLFSATTIFLTSLNGSAPSYQLSLSMQENVAVNNSVPEPASVALLGLGLTGLAFVRRRKQS